MFVCKFEIDIMVDFCWIDFDFVDFVDDGAVIVCIYI